MSTGKNPQTSTGKFKCPHWESELWTKTSPGLPSGITYFSVPLRAARILVNSVPQEHFRLLSYLGDKHVYNSCLCMPYLCMLCLLIYLRSIYSFIAHRHFSCLLVEMFCSTRVAEHPHPSEEVFWNHLHHKAALKPEPNRVGSLELSRIFTSFHTEDFKPERTWFISHHCLLSFQLFIEHLPENQRAF